MPRGLRSAVPLFAMKQPYGFKQRPSLGEQIQKIKPSPVSLQKAFNRVGHLVPTFMLAFFP